MFPFPEIIREYDVYASETVLFNRLSEMTYQKANNMLIGNFTVVDPPTFELYHPSESPRSGKPFATKVSVIIERKSTGPIVVARTSTNPTHWIFFGVLTLSFIVNIVRTPVMTIPAYYLGLMIVAYLWDRHVKKKTLDRLEKVLTPQV